MTAKSNSQIPLPPDKKWRAERVSFEGEAGIAVYFVYDAEILGWAAAARLLKPTKEVRECR